MIEPANKMRSLVESIENALAEESETTESEAVIELNVSDVAQAAVTKAGDVASMGSAKAKQVGQLVSKAASFVKKEGGGNPLKAWLAWNAQQKQIAKEARALAHAATYVALIEKLRGKEAKTPSSFWKRLMMSEEQAQSLGYLLREISNLRGAIKYADDEWASLGYEKEFGPIAEYAISVTKGKAKSKAEPKPEPEAAPAPESEE